MGMSKGSHENCNCFKCYPNREGNEPDCGCEMSPPSPDDYDCESCPKNTFCDIALNPENYRD